uniref:extracellular solute-binding protein n=1 Tax=Clostridium sp. NkU-1 TaxID=1095009 RepID=UPI000A9EBC7E
MRLKRVLAMALAAGMACASLTACGSKTSESSAAGADGATTAAETTKADDKAKGTGEKKVLSVTTWDYDTTPTFQTVVDAYMAKNPNVEINVIDTSADEYNNSLGISLSAAQPDPDVIWVKDMGSMLQMADKNQLLPLDDFMKKDNVDLSVYNGAAEQLQYNGATYGLPYRSDWYVLYYNKDLFDAAGVAYPSNDMTWDEYDALAAKLTSGEGSSKVYGGHNHIWQALVSNWAVQDGKHTVLKRIIPS